MQGRDTYSLYMVYLADAARPCEHGQSGNIAGLVTSEPEQGSTFHSVDWHFHLSKRPAKSSGPAETLAKGEASEMRLIFVRAYCALLANGIHLVSAARTFFSFYERREPTNL